MRIQLTEFSKRHFKSNFSGTKIKMSPSMFEDTINDFYDDIHMWNDDVKLLKGYADFCKLLVIPANFTKCKTGTLPITLETYPYLKSGYMSRNDKELPVLTRWLDIPYDLIPDAKHFVIVLYSKEQLIKENDSDVENFTEDMEYGVVAILAQMSDTEEPMKPSTMIRNALGIEEGGSGVKLDRKKYLESVKFWSGNATVK